MTQQPPPKKPDAKPAAKPAGKPQAKPGQKPGAKTSLTAGSAVAADRAIGSSAGEDGRLRAQAAYEGDDQFSVMSLSNSRRKKGKISLEPEAPGESKEVHIDELPATRKSGVVHFFRKIFEK